MSTEARELAKTFHYRGLEGSAEVSVEDGCLIGKVLGIKDLVIYEGNTVKELEEGFHYMVDIYLEDQAEMARRNAEETEDE